MLPYNPCPLNAQSDSPPRTYAYMQASLLYNEAPREVKRANMPSTTGVLSLMLRVGNPIATYKLNKIENPHLDSDHVFLHLEKNCVLVALW